MIGTIVIALILLAEVDPWIVLLRSTARAWKGRLSSTGAFRGVHPLERRPSADAGGASARPALPEDAERPRPSSPALTGKPDPATRASHEFALALHANLRTSPGNAAFSTLSLRDVLGMLAAGDARVCMLVANAPWVHKEAPLRSGYVEQVTRSFDASVAPIGFTRSDVACSVINQWVEWKTAGKIERVVSAACTLATSARQRGRRGA